jgi:hypothetical protein
MFHFFLRKTIFEKMKEKINGGRRKKEAVLRSATPPRKTPS